MDPELMKSLIESGTALATLIGSGTVTAVNSKIQSIKTEKNADKIRASYDEIINEILQERSEAIMLAQTYKSELDKIVISDKDIEHLQKTIDRVLNLLMPTSVENVDPQNTELLQQIKSQRESINALKGLINADTLKTMQLLGFNYKEAIGEPLTKICAEAIKNFFGSKANTTNKNPQKRNRQ